MNSTKYHLKLCLPVDVVAVVVVERGVVEGPAGQHLQLKPETMV